jgi:N-acetylmuramoyl-L-alanine amidase
MSTVTITAGHSNVDPGAVNKTTGDRESDIVRDMRNMVVSYLTKAGIPVKSDGDGLRNASLSEAVQLIKGSKIAVEFHCNASTNATARGTEALSKPKDKDVSQRLCAAVSSVLHTGLRGDAGWKPEDSGQHSRLAYVSNGGIILELFFVSNPVELDSWKAKKWLVAKAVSTVIEDYYNDLF